MRQSWTCVFAQPFWNLQIAAWEPSESTCRMQQSMGVQLAMVQMEEPMLQLCRCVLLRQISCQACALKGRFWSSNWRCHLGLHPRPNFQALNSKYMPAGSCRSAAKEDSWRKREACQRQTWLGCWPDVLRSERARGFFCRHPAEGGRNGKENVFFTMGWNGTCKTTTPSACLRQPVWPGKGCAAMQGQQRQQNKAV